MKQRIWELDVLRGICILGMVITHLIYDLAELYGLIDWQYPKAFLFIKDHGSILFVLISGICVTLGSRSVRRGIIVFACGMLCTLVTFGMELLELTGSGMTIWFGVLHCLGSCMLLWPLAKKLPTVLLAVLGLALVIAGHLLFGVYLVEYPYLIPLGIAPKWFISPDYFPLMPYFGYFLLGAVLGRTLYRSKTSLLPGCNAGTPVLRFLSLCGRYSLHIYLLHQPILTGLCMLLSALL